MKIADGKPFEFSFLDEAFGNMYASEKRLGNIFGIFAALAIIIACLGLFALTAFTAEQRTKEIGIRKVLGASVTSIVVLLSKEFGKLILIAFLLSLPIVWFAVNWWLESYIYKVEIGIFVYLLAGVFAFLIAWLTMSFQSIRAATSNPVNSLRSE
jgi:putative ABC transport system permease protein